MELDYYGSSIYTGCQFKSSLLYRNYSNTSPCTLLATETVSMFLLKGIAHRPSLDNCDNESVASKLNGDESLLQTVMVFYIFKHNSYSEYVLNSTRPQKLKSLGC